MNIINNIKIKFYPELEKMDIDDKTKKKILENKNLKKQYKQIIKPFIKHLKSITVLNESEINYHINAVFLASINNNSSKYVSIIKKEHAEFSIDIDIQIMEDQNFDEIYSKIGMNVFSGNISKIIKSGNSENLKQYIESGISLSTYITNINPSLLNDKVWSTIKQNPTLGDNKVTEILLNNQIPQLIQIIEKGYFAGLKYIYENMPESHHVIDRNPNLKIELFDLEFIENINKDAFKNIFNGLNTYLPWADIISKIKENKNYELIEDILNIGGLYTEKLREISEEDLKKNIFDIFPEKQTKEIFLNKYFDIDLISIPKLEKFYDAIKKEEFTKEFIEEYGTTMNMLTLIFEGDAASLKEYSKMMDKSKKLEYKKMIEECEIEGNKIIKNHFSNDVNEKYKKMKKTVKHEIIKTESGKDIDVYELSGEEFTMLVHRVIENRMSENNEISKEIRTNPEKFMTSNANDFISCSLISDICMATYGQLDSIDELTFGFSNIPSENIKLINCKDAGTNRDAKELNNEHGNDAMGAEAHSFISTSELIQRTLINNIKLNEAAPGAQKCDARYNEVVLSRQIGNSNERMQPDYLVCMDRIGQCSLKAAEYYGIPIYLIDSKKYKMKHTMEDISIPQLDDAQEILRSKGL